MAKKNQHVIPFANGWAVKEEGKDRLTLISGHNLLFIAKTDEYGRRIAT